MAQNKDMKRRDFLKWLSTGSVLLVGVVAAGIGGRFLFPVKKRPLPPLFVCLETDVPSDGAPLDIKDPKGRKVLLMKKENGDLVSISTICSHLGCNVFYRKKKKIFECPCHQGVFDNDGNPTAGPPQTPLRRYRTVVRKSKVFVYFS